MPSDDERITAALESQHSLSFRWYAQRFDVPVEQAKAELKRYHEAHQSKVHALYLVSSINDADGFSRCVRPLTL